MCTVNPSSQVHHETQKSFPFYLHFVQMVSQMLGLFFSIFSFKRYFTANSVPTIPKSQQHGHCCPYSISYGETKQTQRSISFILLDFAHRVVFLMLVLG